MRLARITAAALVAMTGTFAFAAVPAVSPVNAQLIGNDDDSNGWRFQANTGIAVTELGVWDEFADGFGAATVDVGLWSDTGSLLASATVLSSSPLTAGFRYVAITPLTLSAGTFYRLSASPSTGNLSALADVPFADLNAVPEITFDAGYYANNGNLLAFPDIISADIDDADFFGPNFKFVPEPGTLALLAPIGTLLLRRR
jgi:hypothetical protein